MDQKSQEGRIARAFIASGKRDRFMSLAASRVLVPGKQAKIASKKLHSKYRQMLANLDHWLDPRRTRLPLDTSQPYPEVRKAFSRHGAESGVYVMSHAPEIDGRVMGLDEALAFLATDYVYGTLIVEPTSALAYYEQCERRAMSKLLSAPV